MHRGIDKLEMVRLQMANRCFLLFLQILRWTDLVYFNLKWDFSIDTMKINDCFHQDGEHSVHSAQFIQSNTVLNIDKDLR